jgi:hypothetical protein
LGDFHLRNGSGTIYLHALLKTWPALGVAAKDILIIDEVSDDEIYSFYLQEMLPQAEIINMGAHGYGHDQMLILLKEEGIKYQPDIVILGFLGLDMSRNLLSFRDFAKPQFVLERGRLKLTGVPVPSPEEILEWDWARPRIIDIFSLLSHSVKKFTGIQKNRRCEMLRPRY